MPSLEHVSVAEPVDAATDWTDREASLRIEYMSQMPDDELAATLSRQVMELLHHRGTAQGAALSELAHVIGGRVGRDERDLMRPLRTVLAAMAQQRRIAVSQDGAPVSIESARGPVRVRLIDSSASVSLSSPEQRLRNGFMAERRYTRGS